MLVYAHILIVILHVNSGSTITMQEFTSKEACQRAADHIISERKRVSFSGLESVGCVAKQ